MIATIKILWSSLKMALQELRVNKLRTFLSLLGITIGIFCIIIVLTVTNSLESNVRSDLAALGDDVIFIQKWPWEGGPDAPWWKYANRPEPEFKELKYIEDKVHSSGAAAFAYSSNNKRIEYGDDYMEGVDFMAVTQDYDKVQQISIIGGHFFTGKENDGSSNVAIIGANLWENLFGSAEAALGKSISIGGRPTRIVGVLKKKGSSMLDIVNYDNVIIVPYKYGRTIVDERRYADPYIMVKAAATSTVEEMRDELRGSMRAIRRLKPTEEDDFSLNEITSATGELDTLFGRINIGGVFIAIFALIVGGFGIANIMFVTVKERTSIIGLKKAIGARKNVILMEFLIESILLCTIGGGIGIFLVYLITLVANSLSPFVLTLTLTNIILGLSISAIVGMVAGFIPAYFAARLDPVVAIRSN
jgi:putative ABC transport system permease protein